MRHFSALFAMAFAIAAGGCDAVMVDMSHAHDFDDVKGAADTVCAPKTFYKDLDGDGFGDPSTAYSACEPASAKDVTQAGDCNDTAASVHPGATEQCDNVDNDCNGKVDDTTKSWYVDNDGDGFGNAQMEEVGGCSGSKPWLVANNDDCNDSNKQIHPFAKEQCDNIDNDCNGQTDEVYADLGAACGTGACAGGVKVCSADKVTTVCSTLNKATTETCNGIDDDCNGQTDEGKLLTFFLDDDGDGFGYDMKQVQACSAPVGATATSGDCNDDPVVGKNFIPGSEEKCDGLDNNCNGQVDEGVLLVFNIDADGDGFGDPTSKTTLACTAPAGMAPAYGPNADCDDQDPAVHPGAPEICDGKDNACAGLPTPPKEPDSLCEDGNKLTKDLCQGAKGCQYEDEKVTLSCFNPPEYKATDGYSCSVSYFFGDPTGKGGPFDMTFSKDAVTLLMKDVCPLLKAGLTLRVNSYVWLDFDPAAIWVGGLYTKLINSFTNTAVSGTPGNITLSWLGLDFNYSLADFPECQ